MKFTKEQADKDKYGLREPFLRDLHQLYMNHVFILFLRYTFADNTYHAFCHNAALQMY